MAAKPACVVGKQGSSISETEQGGAIVDLGRRNLVIRPYRARVSQCEAAGEDCQTTQSDTLGFGQ